MKISKEINMKKTTKKVFCKDCKYERDHWCDHPLNLADDAYAPKHTHLHTAEHINQHNSCKWFRQYRAAACEGPND